MRQMWVVKMEAVKKLGAETQAGVRMGGGLRQYCMTPLATSP